MLRAPTADFMVEVSESDWRTFRNTMVTMILETDLAVHQESLKRFKQTFVEDDEAAEKALDASTTKQLLSFVLKTCDVGRGAW